MSKMLATTTRQVFRSNIHQFLRKSNHVRCSVYYFSKDSKAPPSFNEQDMFQNNSKKSNHIHQSDSSKRDEMDKSDLESLFTMELERSTHRNSITSITNSEEIIESNDVIKSHHNSISTINNINSDDVSIAKSEIKERNLNNNLEVKPVEEIPVIKFDFNEMSMLCSSYLKEELYKKDQIETHDLFFNVVMDEILNRDISLITNENLSNLLYSLSIYSKNINTLSSTSSSKKLDKINKVFHKMTNSIISDSSGNNNNISSENVNINSKLHDIKKFNSKEISQLLLSYALIYSTHIINKKHLKNNNNHNKFIGNNKSQKSTKKNLKNKSTTNNKITYLNKGKEVENGDNVVNTKSVNETDDAGYMPSTGYYNKKVIYLLCKNISDIRGNNLKEFNEKELINIVTCFEKLKQKKSNINHSKLMYKIFENVSNEIINRDNIGGVSSHGENSNGGDSIDSSGSSGSGTGGFTPINVTDLCIAYAEMFHYSPKLFTYIGKKLIQPIKDHHPDSETSSINMLSMFSTQQLSKILWSYARLGYVSNINKNNFNVNEEEDNDEFYRQVINEINLRYYKDKPFYKLLPHKVLSRLFWSISVLDFVENNEMTINDNDNDSCENLTFYQTASFAKMFEISNLNKRNSYLYSQFLIYLDERNIFNHFTKEFKQSCLQSMIQNNQNNLYSMENQRINNKSLNLNLKSPQSIKKLEQETSTSTSTSTLLPNKTLTLNDVLNNDDHDSINHYHNNQHHLLQISQLQLDIFNSLLHIGYTNENIILEYILTDKGGYSIDIVLKHKTCSDVIDNDNYKLITTNEDHKEEEEDSIIHIGIEVDGPIHFLSNNHQIKKGSTLIKQRQLRYIIQHNEGEGEKWVIINIPYWDWNAITQSCSSQDERQLKYQRYLCDKIQQVTQPLLSR